MVCLKKTASPFIKSRYSALIDKLVKLSKEKVSLLKRLSVIIIFLVALFLD